MSIPPAENPVPGVVTLTARGDAALDRPGRDVDEVGSASESPDDAACRRLGARTPGAASTPGTRSFNVGR